MNIKDLKALLIPAITKHCKAEIIMADDMGDKPEVPHATYKITTGYGKGVGRAEEVHEETASGGVILKRTETYKVTISFTAYAMDEDDSLELAQYIYDWFTFHGFSILSKVGITVADQTDITNRDAFVVENYERRNGFDVILRVTTEKTRDIDWFDSVAGLKRI